MKTLFLLLASVVAYGVTATPTEITTYMLEPGTYAAASSVNVPPLDVPITVIGSGSWGLARGGTLSTMCGAAYGYCFTISSATSGYANTCVDNLPVGSGATTLYLCWKVIGGVAITPGSYTGTATVGTSTINITLVVVPRPAFSAWVWPSTSYPSGCTTGSGFDTPNNCTPTSERPTSTAFSIPAVSGSYVDPQFGGSVTRVTSAGQFLTYSTVNAFNADASAVFTTDTVGNVNVFPRTGGAALYSAVPGAAESYTSWDPVDPNKLWFYQNATVKYRNLSGASTTTAADYSTSSGSRPAFTTLYTGGTADITDDGWWVFYDATSKYICALNLNSLTTSNQESKVYCANYGTTTPITAIDFPQITQVDSESRKRYVIAMANPAPVVWSVNLTTGVLDQEYTIPVGGVGMASGPPHSDVGQDEFGRQFLYLYGSSAWQGTWTSTYQLNKGIDLVIPTAVGGGWLAKSQTAYGADGHFGCNWTGTCVMETSYSVSITAQAVTSLTTGNPCQINTTGHGYTTGNSIQIGGALGSGATVINGIWSITVLNANAYTIPVNCTGATYTASSGSSAPSSALTAQSFRSEIQLQRPGGEQRRMAIGRFVGYSGNGLLFYRTNYAFPSVSRNGRYIAFNSNYGVPEQPSVYIIDLGFTGTTGLKVNVIPVDTKAIINYSFPDGLLSSAATITISTSPSLTSPVVSVSDGLYTNGRQYIATGLTADTQYYYRVNSGSFSFTGQFNTLSTLSSTGTVRIVKGSGGTVNYGTTSALGSSCTSPCVLTPSKGLLYTDVSGSVAAMLVR